MPDGPRPAVRLTASLFNGDHGRLADEVARVEAADLDALHFDVFDGRLVPDLAFAPRTLAQLRSLTSLPFEVHLAAERPERFARELAEAGADLVLFHAEGAPMAFETVFALREQGLRAGMALGLGGPLEHVLGALELLDATLLLSRVTGEGTRGASFDERVLARVRALRGAIDAAGADVELQVGGGVNRDNASAVAAAGADALVLGAGLYRAPDMAVEAVAVRAAAAGTGAPR